ncbi:MAG: FCD domain-containing protein [Amaricoccus sp.]
MPAERGGAAGLDRAHHPAPGRTIYDASGNPLFRQVLEQLRGHFERFWDQPFGRPDFAGRSFPFHRQLLEAIRDGDEVAAGEHTRAILDIVEEDILSMSL